MTSCAYVSAGAVDIEALVKRHVTGRREYYERLAIAMGMQAEDAKDALQDAILKALTTKMPCQHEDKFEAWFTRILRNTCKNIHTRTNSRHRLLADNTATVSDCGFRVINQSLNTCSRRRAIVHQIAISTEANPLDVVEERMLAAQNEEALTAALQSLPEASRTLLWEAYGTLDSVANTGHLTRLAEAHNINPANLRQRLRRMRQLAAPVLREELAQRN